jgi:hypothetical protein
VAHEYQKHSACDIGTGIEGFEGDALPVAVEDRVGLDFRQEGLCREHIVCVNVAGKVEGGLGVPA